MLTKCGSNASSEQQCSQQQTVRPVAQYHTAPDSRGTPSGWVNTTVRSASQGVERLVFGSIRSLTRHAVGSNTVSARELTARTSEHQDQPRWPWHGPEAACSGRGAAARLRLLPREEGFEDVARAQLEDQRVRASRRGRGARSRRVRGDAGRGPTVVRCFSRKAIVVCRVSEITSQVKSSLSARAHLS